jgi:hypothetical protein
VDKIFKLYGALGWKGILVIFLLGGASAVASSFGLVDISSWLETQKPVIAVE